MLLGVANSKAAMAFSPDDVSALKQLVLKEQGEYTLAYVSRYMDRLRAEGDHKGATLWSMVLAELYHSLEEEKQAACQTPDRPAVVLVSSS